jgi:hypothetical protein
MTIMATCLSVTLGAWRVRLRFDIDEPRELVSPTAASMHAARFSERDVHAPRRHYSTGGGR